MDRPAWFDEELFPFESRVVTVDGARIHYVDEGEGPTLLLLHGNPTWSFLYRHLIAGLSDRFRCVAPDYPGFGLSVAPPGYGYTIREHGQVLEGFVDTLGLDQFTPVMQDWGGPIGMYVATRHPDRIERLIAGNTAAWPFADDRTKARFSRSMRSRAGRFAMERLGIFTNVFLPMIHRRRRPSRREMRMWRGPHPSPASRRGIAVMPEQILGATDLLREIESRLPELGDTPLLLLWGSEDPGFDATDRERWERAFPQHRTVVLQGAGHYWQDDAPDLAVPAIRDWFGVDT